MGITLDKYFENIYSVIFSPKAFFEREDLTVSIRLAATNVTLIASVFKITTAVFDGSIYDSTFPLTLLLTIASALFLWFVTSLFFEFIAKIFNQNKTIEKVLFFTSFAPIPYIFFAPLNLLKSVGTYGYLLGVYSELFLYFWIIFLYALALKSIYKISIARAFMLIFLPFFASFFAIYWIICFCSKIGYIFSI